MSVVNHTFVATVRPPFNDFQFMKSTSSLVAILSLAFGSVSSISGLAADPVFESIDTLKTTIGPVLGLASGDDGFFYGVGGMDSVIFRVAPGQQEEILYTFLPLPNHNVADTNFGGANPSSALIRDQNGDFLGATQYGGAYAHGTIYRITQSGGFSVVCDLPPEIGYNITHILRASTGELYGISSYNGPQFGGTLFQVGEDGKATILYAFDGTLMRSPDGSVQPHYPTSLVEGSDHQIYGGTGGGGNPTNGGNSGTFYRYDGPGSLTVLTVTNEAPGSCVARNGGFYISTENSLDYIALDGTLTELHSWLDDFPGESYSSPNLLLMPDGLYGITVFSGAMNNGFVFHYTPEDGAKVIYNFGTEYYGRTRCLTAGIDDLVYGLVGLPEGGAASASAMIRGTANAKVAQRLAIQAVQNTAPPKAKTFRFRKAGTSSANFVPVAYPDEAWLPTMAFQWQRSVTVDVVANDRDRDKDVLKLTGVLPPETGAVSLVTVGRTSKVKFTTGEADPASQLIQYQITDGKGGNATGILSIRTTASGKYTGTPLDTTNPSSPTGLLTLNIGAKNIVNAVCMLGKNRYTGKGEIGVDEVAHFTLTCKTLPVLNMHLAVQRGTDRKIAVTFQGGGDTYSAVCSRAAN